MTGAAKKQTLIEDAVEGKKSKNSSTISTLQPTELPAYMYSISGLAVKPLSNS